MRTSSTKTKTKKTKLYPVPEGFVAVRSDHQIYLNAEGVFFNAVTGKQSTNYCYRKNGIVAFYTYRVCNDLPDAGKSVTLPVHSLVAAIFVPVPEDLLKLPMLSLSIGLRDGDKTNAKASNLYWKRSVKCKSLKVTYLVTGEVQIFESLREAHQALCPNSSYASFRLAVRNGGSVRKKLKYEYVTT